MGPPGSTDPHDYRNIHVLAEDVPGRAHLTWNPTPGNSSFYFDTGARGFAYEHDNVVLPLRPAEPVGFIAVEASNSDLPADPRTMHGGRTEPVHAIVVDKPGPGGGVNTLAAQAENVRWFFYHSAEAAVPESNAVRTSSETEAWLERGRDARAYGRASVEDGDFEVLAQSTSHLVGFQMEILRMGETAIRQEYALYAATRGAAERRASADSAVGIASPQLSACLADELPVCDSGMKLGVRVGDESTPGALRGGARAVMYFPQQRVPFASVLLESPLGMRNAHFALENHQPAAADGTLHASSGGFQTISFSDVALPPVAHFQHAGGHVSVRTRDGALSGRLFISDTGDEGEWGGSPLEGDADSVAHVKLKTDADGKTTLAAIQGRTAGLESLDLCTSSPTRIHPDGDCVVAGQRLPNIAAVRLAEAGISLAVRVDNPRDRKLFEVSARRAPAALAAWWDTRGEAELPRSGGRSFALHLDASGGTEGADAFVLLPAEHPTQPGVHLGDGVLEVRNASIPPHARLTNVIQEIPAHTYLQQSVRGESPDDRFHVLLCGAGSRTWTLSTILGQAIGGPMSADFVKATSLEKAEGGTEWTRDRSDRWNSLQIADVLFTPGPRGSSMLELTTCTENGDVGNPNTYLLFRVHEGQVRLHARKYLIFWTRAYLSPACGSSPPSTRK